MAVLTRAKILSADDLVREKVEVPEWGGEVYVRSMTGRERDAFEAQMIEGDKGAFYRNIRARMAVLCTVDEKGARVFEDKDTQQLGDKASKALSRIFDVAQRLNGFSDSDIEELEGNSGGGLTDVSISA